MVRRLKYVFNLHYFIFSLSIYAQKGKCSFVKWCNDATSAVRTQTPSHRALLPSGGAFGLSTPRTSATLPSAGLSLHLTAPIILIDALSHFPPSFHTQKGKCSFVKWCDDATSAVSAQTPSHRALLPSGGAFGLSTPSTSATLPSAGLSLHLTAPIIPY